jgi:hypothetical protein
MLTPASTWCPAFDHAGFPWLRTFPISEVFSQQRDGRFYCRLCESFLTDYGPDWPVLTDHARHHKFEYREWRAERAASAAALEILEKRATRA